MRKLIVCAIIFSVAFLGFSFPPKPSCYSCNSTGIVTCGKCSGSGQIRKRIQDRDNRRNRQPKITTVNVYFVEKQAKLTVINVTDGTFLEVRR